MDSQRVTWYGVTGNDLNERVPQSPIEPMPTLGDRVSAEATRTLRTVFPNTLFQALQDIFVGLPSAAAMVLNNASNDMVTLLDEVWLLDGRPAARTARTMFESLVTMHDVTTSPEMAQRYLEHAAITERQLARLRPGVDRLSGNLRRRVEHQMRKRLKAAERSLMNVSYPAFDRGFTTESLFARAQRHGLVDQYDAYRLLSAPTHGTSGSLVGTRKEIEELIVHRTGPNVELAAVAYIEGVQWFAGILPIIPASHQYGRFGSLVESTEALLRAWPEICRAVLDLETELWPSTPPPQPLALAVFYGESVRWFLWDRRVGVVWPADGPPADPPDVEGEIRAETRSLRESYDSSEHGDRPFTVGVQASVTPRKGAAPISASVFVGSGTRPPAQ